VCPTRPGQDRDEGLEQISLWRQTLAAGAESPQAIASEWIEAGFDATAVSNWLGAGCFDAGAALRLDNAGVHWWAAALEHDEDGYQATIGYKVSNADMSIADAIKHIERAAKDDPDDPDYGDGSEFGGEDSE